MGLSAKNRVDTQITKHLNQAIDLIIQQTAMEALKLDRQRIREHITKIAILEASNAVVPLEDVLNIVDHEVASD